MVIPPALYLLLRIALAVQGLSCSPINFSVVCLFVCFVLCSFFPISVKNVTGFRLVLSSICKLLLVGWSSSQY